MSTTIDQRVVEMRFDNSHFEKNVSTTMSTLDKLKQSLKLQDPTNSFKGLGNAVKNVSMDGLASGVQTVTNRFSALQVMGVTALANITNSAVNAGKQIVRSLTIQPITTGFNEYELKMGSIQTIMASTGESLDTVNSYLEELNAYSDQTIYSFSDMTQNIGKFTNAGVKLEDAVAAIKGISNEAALSGANANEASRAMYNFSQALSAGYVKLIDWKSIENANMATVGFKEELIKTAVEMGTLTKVTDGYKTAEDTVITATKNFNDSLQDQWMTSDVLIETLKKYTDVNTEIGAKATQAATEVKTFSQMLDTLKESAQSGWAGTWEAIFGDFNEGKSLWTYIASGKDGKGGIGGLIDNLSKSRNNYINRVLNQGNMAWDELIGKIEAAGVKSSDFEKILINTMEEGGLNVDELVEKYGSLSKVFQSNESYAEYLKKALGGVSESMTELTGITDKLNKGMSGKQVKQMQDALNRIGYNLGEPGIDGIFGSITESAVKSFQADVGLKATGILDSETLAALRKELESTSKAVGKLDGDVDELISGLTKTSGKQLIFDSIKHAIEELKKPLQIVKDVWNSDMFDGLRLSSDELYGIIEAVTSFINELKFGEDAAKNFESVCTGVFALLDIQAWIMKGSIKTFFQLLNIVLDAFDTDLLSVAASIAEYITKFRDWIKTHTIFIGMTKKIGAILVGLIEGIENCIDTFLGLDAVQDTIKFFTDLLVGLFGVVGEGIESINVETWVNKIKAAFESISNWIESHEDAIAIGLNIIEGIVIGITSGVSKVVGAIKEIATAIINAFKSILGIHSPSTVFMALGGFIIAGLILGLLSGIPGVGEALEKIGDKLKSTFKNIDFGETFGDIWNNMKRFGSKIIDVFKNLDYEALFVAGTLIALVVILNKVTDVLKGFAKPFESFAGIGDSIKNFLDGAKQAAALNAKTEMILAIAKAIAILAASIFVLSLIPVPSLAKAVTTVAFLGAGLAVLMSVVSKFPATEFGKLSVLMTSLALAILVVSAAITVLSKIQVDRAWSAIGQLGVMLAELMVFFGVLTWVSKFSGEHASKAGTMFIKMAIAIGALALVIKLMAGISPEDMKRGALVMAGALGLFAGITAISKLSGRSASKAGTMLLKMAITLGLLVMIVKMVAGISEADINKGAVVIGSTLGVFSLIVAISYLAGEHASKAGTMLLKMAVAIGIMIYVTKMAASLSQSELDRGLEIIATFGVVLAAFIAVSHLAGENAGKAGKMLIGFALAVGILAITMRLMAGLSQEDTDKATQALIGIGAVFALMIAVSTLAGKHADKAGKMLLSASIGMLLLSAAIALLSFIDPSKLWNATGAIVAVLAMFALLVAATADIPDDSMSKLVVLTVAATLLATAIGVLALLDPAKVAVASAAISAVMFMFQLLVRSTSAAGQATGTILLLTGVLVAIAAILGIMTYLDVEPSIQTAIALSILLLALTAALKILNGVQTVSASAINSLYAISGVVAVLAIILGVMSALDVEGSIPTVVALSTLLLAMSAAVVIISKVQTVSASAIGALYAISGVVAILAIILGAMAALDVQGSITTAVALSTLLLAMSAALVILSGIQSVSASAIGALYAISGVVAILGVILGVMSHFDVAPSIETALSLSILLVAMSAVTGILALIGPIAGGALAGLGAFAAVVVGIGALLVAVGALAEYLPGVETFLSKGITVLEKLASGIGSIISKFAEGLTSNFPAIGQNLSDFMSNLQGFLSGMSSIDDSMGDKVSTLVDAVKDLRSIKGEAEDLAEIDTSAMVRVANGVKKMADTIAGLSNVNSNGVTSLKSALGVLGGIDFSSVASSVSAGASSITSAGAQISSSLASGINSGKGQITAAATSSVSAAASAIQSQISIFRSAGITISTTLANSIKTGTSTIRTGITSALSAAVATIRSYRSGFYSAGSYCVSGFAAGITANTFVAEARARAMALSALNAAKRALAIRSPSREFYAVGNFAGMGFVNALSEYAPIAHDAGFDMADSARVGLKDAVGKVTDLINNGIETQPTIRPIMDLSDVKSGTDAIEGMLNKQSTIGVMANVGAINTSMNRMGQNGGNTDVVSAIKDLGKMLGNRSGDTYQVGDITYDDGSNITNAIKDLTRAAIRERRV